MNYIVVAIFCIIALVIGIFSLTENELIEFETKKLFFVLAVITILEIVTDTIGFHIDGRKTTSIEFYKVVKALELICAPIIPAILAKIITRNSYWSKVRTMYVTLIIVNALCQIITMFVPFIFQISRDAKYVRTNFTIIYILILLASVFLLLVSSSQAFIQSSVHMNCTLLLSVIFVVVGIVVRLILEKSNSDWLAITFSYFIFMLYFNNCYLKIDATTALLNRKAFDSKLDSIKYTTALIVIDANNFKSINDTYGHARGDWALFKIAEAILNVYSKVGYCYRIGGDEFCVILKEGIIKSNVNEGDCDRYAILQNMMEALNEELKKDGNQNSILKFGVSQGYGIYFALKDTSVIDQHKTIEEVLKIADERMYKNKKRTKLNVV